jgi:4-hydroxybenzoate polyprenyltransferase
MTVAACLKLLRPVQWLKNLMLYFPPILGGVIAQSGMATRGVLPFIAFCLASSSIYLLNDIVDRDQDREHPVKRFRPIAAGTVAPLTACFLAGGLVIGGILLGASVSRPFVLLLLGYLAVAVSYTLWLKNVPIVDLFCISAGFLLRLMAGGEVFGIVVSEWLFLSVFLLSLFLSTGKRLSEKYTLGEQAASHRKTLGEFPEGFLEGTMYMTGAAVLVTYTMYVISRHMQMATVILCTFGLLRYIFRIRAGEGGDPTESLLKDPILFGVGLLWALMVSWGIYGG